MKFTFLVISMLFCAATQAKDCSDVVDGLLGKAGFAKLNHPGACYSKSSSGGTETLVSQTSSKVTVKKEEAGTMISFYPSVDPILGVQSSETTNIVLNNENCKVSELYVRIDEHNVLSVYDHSSNQCPKPAVADHYRNDKVLTAKLQKYCKTLKPLLDSSPSQSGKSNVEKEKPATKAQ